MGSCEPQASVFGNPEPKERGVLHDTSKPKGSGDTENHPKEEARALARATIINYVPFIHAFLKDCFGKGPATLSRLNAQDIVRSVQQQATKLHQKLAKLLTCALRSFLRYARYRGDLKLDLAAAVPVVPNWSMPSIPRGIGMQEVRHLLASINRRTAMGRRDYAILLLLARLGLRSSEIALLDLEDIDWKAGREHRKEAVEALGEALKVKPKEEAKTA